MSRWYDRETLELVPEVKSADGKKMVKTTLAHARKQGFLPSVTTIIADTMAKGEQLLDWIVDQNLKACIAFPFDRNPNIDIDVSEYKKMIRAKANEFRDYTANRGNELHDHVHTWAKSGRTVKPDDPVGLKIISYFEKEFSKHDITELATEMAVGGVHIGYVGTTDIYLETPEYIIFYDLKTTSFKGKSQKFKPYDSWMTQLGGYSGTLITDKPIRLMQAIADRDHGDVIFLEHKNIENWQEHFRNLYRNWCIQKNFFPMELDV